MDRVRGVGDQLLTKKEVAEILAVSERTLDRILARGKLTKVKVGGCVRLMANEIDAVVKGIKSV
jgi:excisionase family DNA binding protein